MVLEMNASLARRPVLASDRAGASVISPAPAPLVYERAWRGIVVLGDLVALGFAFGIAVAIVWRLMSVRPSLGACVVAALLLMLAFAAHDLHEKTYAILRRDELYYAPAVTMLCAVLIVPCFFVIDMSLQSCVAVALGVLLSGATIGMMRYFLRGGIGEGRLFIEPRVRMVTPPSADVETWLAEICSDGAPTHLVISEIVDGAALNDIARAAARRGIVVAIAEKSCSAALSVRGLVLDGSTLLELDVPRVDLPWGRRTKRAFDVFVAAMALAAATPVLLLAALAILLEDGAPVFYTQPRTGRDGNTFRIFKLRSMRADAEARTGPVWAVDGDERATRVGRVLRRTSIDELPQLVNVLRGEMSIVGPRPERPVFVKAFSAELPQYRERLIVAPGITACSHLYMPRSIESDAIGERLGYDLYYIRNWSLAMDIALLLKTAAEVAFHRAA